MKREILALFSIVLFVGLIASVSAVPPEHMTFYGSLPYSNETAIPDGYYVIAKIGDVVSGQCKVINGSYGTSSRPCVISTHSTTNPKVEFFLGDVKLDKATFNKNELVDMNFNIDELPSRILPPASNGVCEIKRGECSYNLLDCDNSISKVCAGNGICDTALGETCSNTPSDCGVCLTGMITPADTNNLYENSNDSSSENNESVVSTENNTFFSINNSGLDLSTLDSSAGNSNILKMTGAAIGDFVKTPVGKGVIAVIILVILLILVFSKKGSKKDLEQKEISITKIGDVKKK
jgi:hypothetical protein